jgi:hypothetical protein
MRFLESLLLGFGLCLLDFLGWSANFALLP